VRDAWREGIGIDEGLAWLFFVNDGSICYELGVATGALTGKLARHSRRQHVRWIGIDCEKDMIEQARMDTGSQAGVELIVDDICKYPSGRLKIQAK
jgi:tRNA (cmo5U34)-methyltransferase